jgi:nucleoside-diphosphate-sugar epimerase
VISLFISALCDGRQPKIYGDGEHTRDFTYVANVVDGVLRACTAQGASGEVINVATAGRISLNQLFRTVRDLVGANLEPFTRSRARATSRTRRPISARRSVCSATSRSCRSREGLRNTVNWYRAAQMTTVP